MANSQFGLSLASDEVLFTVMNDVGIASNIAEVYFDDGLLGPSSAINSLGGFTDFEGADMSGTTPPNLPGGAGAEPPFEATVLLSVDVNPGPPSKGINQADDILGIRLGVGDLVDFDGIVAAVADGSLRFGLHVRSIGVAGGSDSYVNNLPFVDPDPPPGVPVPGTVLLTGLGLVGLARMRRTRR